MLWWGVERLTVTVSGLRPSVDTDHSERLTECTGPNSLAREQCAREQRVRATAASEQQEYPILGHSNKIQMVQDSGTGEDARPMDEKDSDMGCSTQTAGSRCCCDARIRETVALDVQEIRAAEHAGGRSSKNTRASRVARTCQKSSERNEREEPASAPREPTPRSAALCSMVGLRIGCGRRAPTRVGTRGGPPVGTRGGPPVDSVVVEPSP